jgi:hypothetical protein
MPPRMPAPLVAAQRWSKVMNRTCPVAEAIFPVPRSAPMITVTDRRRHAQPWRRRRRNVRLDATTAFIISRAAWRMYRGRWPWSRGRRLHR